jgi:hypothetical protein
MQFLSFLVPLLQKNEKSISRIIDFCLSSTFLRVFYRVRKIARTFETSFWVGHLGRRKNVNFSNYRIFPLLPALKTVTIFLI